MFWGVFMNNKIFILMIFHFFIVTKYIFCFEPIATSALLTAYLENNTDIKENTINVQKAALSLDAEKINNGFDLTLSTGNFIINFDEKKTVSFKPSVEANIPLASDFSVTASTNLAFENSKFSANDSKLNLSVELIGSTKSKRQIELLKAERTLAQAKQKLKKQAIICEKSFYTELKTILNSVENIINLQKTLYTNKIDFETVKAQGYSTNSSKYRLTQMKILSAQHEIENAKRDLIHSYVVFYKKCGYDIFVDENFDFYKFIPQDITEIEPLDIHNFEENLYSEVENAVWTNKINSTERKIQSNFSLKANSGVTFNNSATKSNTIDAGFESNIGGLNLAAGVSLPVAKSKFSPSVTLSFAVSPNKYRLNSITAQANQLDEKQELLSIENARSNYETTVVEYEQKLIDLVWNKKSDNESYEMYKNLENDLKKWYKDGFVTESEYYSAKVNAQSYYVKNVINSIEFIIYNNDIIIMFVEEFKEKV